MNDHRVRVLIVDDDPNGLRYFTIEMSLAGHVITTADSSHNAMNLLDQNAFHLVITDLSMFEYDGLEILRKAKEKNPYCEVILVTGRGSEEDAVRALREGAFDYLRKPVDRLELLQKVEQAIERGQNRKSRAEHEAEMVQLVKQRTEELETSRREYQNLFENLSEGIYRTDANETIVLCNQRFARIFGYEDTLELIGRSVRDLYFNLGDRDKLLQELQREGLVENYLEKVRTKEGTAIVVSVNASAIDYDPAKQGWVEGSVSDVTEGTTNAEIWRLSHQLSTDAIYVVGFDKRFRYVNKSVCAVLGYDESELLNKPFTMIVHPADASRIAAKLNEFGSLRNNILRYEFRALGKDGREIWIYAESKHCDYLGESCVIGFGRDISASKQEDRIKEINRIQLERMVRERTETLERERNKYHAILDGLEEPVNIISPDHIVKYQNKKSRDLYGDGEGKKCFKVFDCENIKRNKCNLEKEFKQDAIESYYERTYKDGKIFRYGSRLFKDLDEQDAILEIGMDITELRKHEAKSRLTEKLATLGQLAMRMSHDVIQPLGHIGLNVALIRNHLQGVAPDEEAAIQHRLDTINNTIEQVQLIIDNFRGLSPSNMSAIQPTDPNEIARRALHMVSDQFRQYGISQFSDFAEKLPFIEVARDRIEIALINLLVNAIQAVTAKAEAFTYTGETPCITLRTCRPKGGKVRFAVSDNGIGIPRKIRAKIFDPFFTTKSEGVSQGLGLAIISDITKENRGNINFSSRSGKGSTFWLDFPVYIKGE